MQSPKRKAGQTFILSMKKKFYFLKIFIFSRCACKHICKSLLCEITFSLSFNWSSRTSPFSIFLLVLLIRNFKWLIPSERHVQILHRDCWFHSSSLVFRFHLEVREVSDCWLPPSNQNSNCFHFRTNSDPWKFQLWKGRHNMWKTTFTI